ncbi:MAG TPA: elongation factor G [Acidobacteriaceae bacterium]
MKVYAGSEVRNVAVVGHAHSGKTSLISAILKTARMPAPTDGGDVTAYDEEEIARKMTMANAVAFAEWNGIKVNLMDTPGFHMFAHEARGAMLPAEAAVVLVNAQTGIEAVTDRVWKFAAEAEVPRVVVINQVDHPKAQSTAALLETLSGRWGRQVAPVQLPIVDQKGFHGVVDLVTMEAFLYTADGDGRGVVGAIPEELAEEAKAAHEALIELVAEGKDELMEEFFAVGTIPEEHLIGALHEAIREDRIFPVLYASGLRNVGTDHLLDFLKVYAPSPLERPAFAARGVAHSSGKSNGSGSEGGIEMVMRTIGDGEPVTLYVYKTIIDPFAGRISFFKVLGGCIKTDAPVENYARRESERMTHLSVAQGRRLIEVGELHAGDLGAVAKLRVTQSGDTLGAKEHEISIEPAPVPEPAMTYAIEPKTRADEDKLAPALHKLMEEDLLLRFYRDPQTNEFLLAGSGQLHIETVVARLRKRFHTEVALKSPKVPYRETVRVKATGHGRHKKQTGGHGQFADCKIHIEPLARGGGFEFVNDIFGGSIPRQYVPAVEKGVQESAARGYLAGYPVVDFRAVVFDGAYHDVDSSEMAFKMAGRAAFRACMEQAKPALLEPVMRVEIEAPDEFAGAVMGDLNSRRGRVQGMESTGAATVVRAEVPLAEMLSYGTTLTSMTQGRGSFRMEMDHYDFVPAAITEKITAGAKRPAGDDADE